MKPAPIEIDNFQKVVLAAFPEASISRDAPDQKDGNWWLDVRLAERTLPVTWSEKSGFGLFTDPNDDFGTRPNEQHMSAQTAAPRFVQMLRALSTGQASAALTLTALRELNGVSQAELAQRLGVKQPAVSKLENRAEILVETLQRAISELGAKLVLTVRHPTFDAEFELPPTEQDDGKTFQVTKVANPKVDDDFPRLAVTYLYEDERGYVLWHEETLREIRLERGAGWLLGSSIMEGMPLIIAMDGDTPVAIHGHPSAEGAPDLQQPFNFQSAPENAGSHEHKRLKRRGRRKQPASAPPPVPQKHRV